MEHWKLFVLEGKFADVTKFITLPIQQSINTYCMWQLREKPKIVLSNLGQDAALPGTVAAIMEELFEISTARTKLNKGFSALLLKRS